MFRFDKYDQNKLLRIIKHRKNKDELYYKQFTLLSIATRLGHEKCVKYLLVNEVDINKKNKDDTCALYWAIWKANHDTVCRRVLSQKANDIIHLLLENNAKPNNMCLYSAVSNKNSEIVEMLLMYKANVNDVVFGKTILETAIYRDNIDIVKLLIKYGANVDSNNVIVSSIGCGSSTFYHKKDVNIVKFLSEECDVDYTGYESLAMNYTSDSMSISLHGRTSQPYQPEILKYLQNKNLNN